MAAAAGEEQLTLKGCIGFSGNVPGALKVHPDREHLIFPLGCNVVIEKIGGKKQQTFLQGHNDFVSCIAVSKSGDVVASGQQTHMGFEADIIIWDFATRKELRRFKLHRVKVQDLSFSPSGKYLVSLGGEDDGKVSVWDVATGKALCSATTGNGRGGFAEAVCYANTTDGMFLTGGNETLRQWSFDTTKRKMAAETVAVRGLRRVVQCIAVDEDDQYAYCGTTTGDIIQIGLSHSVLKHKGGKFEKGVTALAITGAGDELLVGTGTGRVCLVKVSNWKVKQSSTACVGAVTSVALRGAGHEFFIGTKASNVYRFSMAGFESSIRAVSPSSVVNDIQFAHGTSQLYGTCSGPMISVWQTETNRELLRITVPNKVCNAFVFLNSGEAIVSGWDDGAIRVHSPESGSLLFEVPNGNGKGVTAIAALHSCRGVMSGGGDGQVRLWEIAHGTLVLKKTLKEHTGAITSIMMNTTDVECVTSSVDGTCIVWDLELGIRSQILFANTLFKQVRYNPEEHQVLTVGTDRKVGYWEVYDGSLIREMELSLSGAVNSIDISSDGNYYAVGGKDKVVKVFSYKEGERSHVGVGHSGAITRLKICPEQRSIVSVSTDGAILVWDYPHGPK